MHGPRIKFYSSHNFHTAYICILWIIVIIATIIISFLESRHFSTNSVEFVGHNLKALQDYYICTIRSLAQSVD